MLKSAGSDGEVTRLNQELPLTCSPAMPCLPSPCHRRPDALCTSRARWAWWEAREELRVSDSGASLAYAGF